MTGGATAAGTGLDCTGCDERFATTAARDHHLCDAALAGNCVHCDRRLTRGDTFSHKGFEFCPDCVSALVSWMLDGGEQEDPEQFAYIAEPPAVGGEPR